MVLLNAVELQFFPAQKDYEIYPHIAKCLLCFHLVVEGTLRMNSPCNRRKLSVISWTRKLFSMLRLYNAVDIFFSFLLQVS